MLEQSAPDGRARQRGQKLKLGVSDTFLAHDVMRNPTFQDSAGKFDADRFKQAAGAERPERAGFFAEERQRLLREALTATAAGDMPVSQGLLEAQYRYRQRAARCALLHRDHAGQRGRRPHRRRDQEGI